MTGQTLRWIEHRSCGGTLLMSPPPLKTPMWSVQVLDGHSYQGRPPGQACAICLMCRGMVGKHSNIIKELFLNFCMYIVTPAPERVKSGHGGHYTI
jgi:hypothetical protein